MSLAEIIQAFGWIPVCWLLAVHILIRLGRMPRHGTGVRVAGYVAALTIAAAAVTTRMWPIAVLGLLFMRTELLGHRHHHEREAHRMQTMIDRFRRHPDLNPGPVPAPRHAQPADEGGTEVRIHHGPSGVGPGRGRHPEYTVPGMTAATATTLRARTHEKNDPDFVPAAVGLREGHAHPEAHHETDPAGSGMRFLSSAKHFTDVVLKLEIIAVVVIALVLFGVWAEGQRRDFTQKSDRNVCQLSYSC